MKKTESNIYLLVLDEDGQPNEVFGPFGEENEQEAVEGVLRRYPAVLEEDRNGSLIRMVFRQGRGVASRYTAGWLDRIRARVREQIARNHGAWLQ